MKSLLAVLMLAASTVVFAGPTGLALMPIADILRHREAVVQQAVTGHEPKYCEHYDHDAAFEVGLINRIEVGFDYDCHRQWTSNLKLQLLNENDLKKGAFSIGTCNFTNGKGEWYSVGRFDGNGYRLHAGVWNTDELHGMIGLDAPYRDTTVTLEYIGGTGARYAASWAFNVKQIPGLNIQLIGSMPVKRSDGFDHSAVITYGFRF